MTWGKGAIVYIAGTPWDGVTGTDRRLATALSASVPILWVDPPFSVMRFRHLHRTADTSIGLDKVAPGICRLRTVVPPGFTRPVMKSIASWIVRRRLRATVQVCRIGVQAVVLASTLETLPRKSKSPTVYYMTDDWLAGADMMGLERASLARRIRNNLKRADLVAAVSADLLERYCAEDVTPCRTLVLPNGCEPLDPKHHVLLQSEMRDGHAVLIGQLNERLDFAVIQAVADSGIDVVMIGPRTERNTSTRQVLDRLIAHKNVCWLGRLNADELPAHLIRASVGLTPYANSEFNRASFPLKTLDYLAAGLPVVSTDLPAVRWLNTDLIATADTVEKFVEKVQILVRDPGFVAASRIEERRRFVDHHSWSARADQLLNALASMSGSAE